MADKKIKWSELVKFSPKQQLATKLADEFGFLLYGGAAGGGKSYWLRWYPIRWLIKTYQETGLKNLVFGLFCEDYPALKDRHIIKMQQEYPEWLGALKEDAIYGLSFRLRPELGGGIIALRNLDDPSKYFSAEFAGIGVDELTKNTKETFDFLRFRKRWPGLKQTKFIAGSNPGGIGHEWVKKLWIDKQFPQEEKEKEQFQYVRATVDDNPHIDPSYIKSLESLPPDLQRAYRYGDWDIFAGQFFTEFRREIHVVRPFEIPDTFRHFGGLDFGSTNPFAFYWVAIDWNGDYWVYKEYYKRGETAENNAKMVKVYTDQDEFLEMVVADRSIFSKQGYGETIADILRRNGIGQPGTNIPLLEASMGGKEMRVARAQLFRQKLYWNERQRPQIHFFDTCLNAIRTIPSLIHDDHNLEDVNTNGEDHSYDAITYLLQKLEDMKVKKPATTMEQKFEEMKKSEMGSVDFTLNKRYNDNV